MKTKRCLSLMLSLTLAVSLTTPAMAAEETPPMAGPSAEEIVPLPAEPVTWRNLRRDDIWNRMEEEYNATHQAEYEAFDANAWFDEVDYYWWSREEYMEIFGLDEEGFKAEMWSEYISAAVYDQVMEAYNTQLLALFEEAFPGELEALDTNELLAQKGYLDPMTAYMEEYGLESPEAARENLLTGYIEHRREVADRHDRAEAYRTADPESWANFDADAYFAREWSYWTKEEFMTSWRDLRTEEEFVECLYVEYMESLTWNNWSYEEYPLTLVVNGFDYDAELTAVDGVTYASPEVVNAILGTHYTDELVPLRPAAVAEGWDVVWNQYTNEVALLNRELLLKGIYVDDETLASVDEVDEWGYEGMGQKMLGLMGELEGNVIYQDFSKFDEMVTRVLSTAKWEPGQSYRTTQTMDITLTAFNSLDGDKDYTFTIKADAVARDNVIDLTVSVNAVELLDLLGQPALDQLAMEMPKINYQNLKTLLTGCKAEVILNGGEGKLYWNVPLLALFDDTVSENTWFAADLSGMGQEDEGLSILESVLADREWDTAALLYEMLLDSSENDYWGAGSAYSDYAMARVMANLLVGGDAVTERNGALTWKLDAQRLGDWMTMVNPYEETAVDSLFRELEVTVSVDRNGKQTASAVVRPDMDAIAAQSFYWMDAGETALLSWVLNLFDFRFTAEASGTADRSTGAAEFHWKNQFKLEMTTDSSRRAVKEEPRTVPPAGAELVEM